MILGGRLRSNVHRRGGFGRLRWTTYGHTEAVASGIAWGRFSPGRYNLVAYVAQATVKLRLYDPVDGVFTRLTYTEHYSRNPQFMFARLRGKTRTYHWTYRK